MFFFLLAFTSVAIALRRLLLLAHFVFCLPSGWSIKMLSVTMLALLNSRGVMMLELLEITSDFSLALSTDFSQ